MPITLGTAVGAATILFLFGGATVAVLILFTRHRRKNESKSCAINSTLQYSMSRLGWHSKTWNNRISYQDLFTIGQIMGSRRRKE